MKRYISGKYMHCAVLRVNEAKKSERGTRGRSQRRTEFNSSYAGTGERLPFKVKDLFVEGIYYLDGVIRHYEK